MKHQHLLLLALVSVLAPPTIGFAQTSAVPSYISYQGTVAAADGTAVGGNNAPVNRSVVFRIWNHSTNSDLGSLLYSETQVVTIADGQFSVLVGEGVATTVGNYGTETGKKLADIATAFAGQDCYLGVTVAAGAALATTDNEISPRQRIVSTGFAFRAKVAESLVGTASLAGGSDFTLNPSSLPAGSVATNYGLGWYGTNRTFNNAPVDGPVLYGNSGGALGASNGVGGTKSVSLLWNNSGQVGIGATASFATGNKLTLQGDDSASPASQLAIRGNTDTNKRLLVGYNTSTNFGTLQPYSAAATTGDLLLNPAGGNVGIGMTTAPAQKLQVNGSVASLGHTFASGDTDGGLFSPGDGLITLKTNNTERVRVDGSGNVGIGTNAPGFPLNFANVLGDKIALWGNSGNSYGFGVQGGLLQIHTDSSGGDIAFGYGSSAAMTETMRIKGNGDLTVKGLVQMGSGTGTAEAPNRAVITRRVNTSTTNLGTVVATSSGLRVIRDGTNGGMRIRVVSGFNNSAFYKIYNENGALIRSVNKGYNSETADIQLCTEAERVSRIEIGFGDSVNGSDWTELALTRFISPINGSVATWVGFMTSTVNQ